MNSKHVLIKSVLYVSVFFEFEAYKVWNSLLYDCIFMQSQLYFWFRWCDVSYISDKLGFSVVIQMHAHLGATCYLLQTAIQV